MYMEVAQKGWDVAFIQFQGYIHKEEFYAFPIFAAIFFRVLVIYIPKALCFIHCQHVLEDNFQKPMLFPSRKSIQFMLRNDFVGNDGIFTLLTQFGFDFTNQRVGFLVSPGISNFNIKEWVIIGHINTTGFPLFVYTKHLNRKLLFRRGATFFERRTAVRIRTGTGRCRRFVLLLCFVIGMKIKQTEHFYHLGFGFTLGLDDVHSVRHIHIEEVVRYTINAGCIYFVFGK